MATVPAPKVSPTPEGSGTVSPQPIDALKPKVDQFDSHLRLLIAIAAKVASLTILVGRYHADADINIDAEEDPEATQKELDVEQSRAKHLQADTVKEATHWLVSVCNHLKVDINTLPDSPVVSSGFEKEVPREKHFDVAWELVLLSLGNVADPSNEKDKESPLSYSASSRALVFRTASYLGLVDQLDAAEKTIAQTLYFQLQATEAKQQGKSKTQEATDAWAAAANEKREEAAKQGSTLKWAATGVGFVLGGVAIGLTGGLAAPALAPLLAGTLGLSFFGTAGGAVLIGTLLGLGGGGLAGYRTHRRLKGLDELTFEPIKTQDVPAIPSLSATIVVSGFLLDLSDSVDPWRPTFENKGLDVFALKADPGTFLEAGTALDKWVRNKAIKMGGTEVIKHTALSALYAGVALPLAVFGGLTTALDSDFSRCRDKAKKAGLLLAEILEKRIQGNRPATLIGYGPGATVVYEALLELHRRELGNLVYSAILISLPNSPNTINWASARSVVAHRFVNCYSTNDWVLAINARLYGLAKNVAGLHAVNLPGIDNVDVTDLVGGHLEIRKVVDRILERVEHGTQLVAPQEHVM